jgi:hypothetical protein
LRPASSPHRLIAASPHRIGGSGGSIGQHLNRETAEGDPTDDDVAA